MLCVGSATVWICGGFPGCLSYSTANFWGFFHRVQDFVLHFVHEENDLMLFSEHFSYLWHTVWNKKKKITSEQCVILLPLPHSLPPPSWRCNPSATYSLCIIFRWLSWRSDFVEVSLSDCTPERMKRWWCWNAAVRAGAFFRSFPCIPLTKFSGSQCSAPLSAHNPSYWFMAGFVWEF